MRIRSFIAVAIFTLIALHGSAAFADTSTAAPSQFQFQPIVAVPLPTGSGSGHVDATTSLVDYLNTAFMLAIGTSAILAVIMIVFEGFKYMASDAIGQKKQALDGLRGAIFGLILLLLSYIMISYINPQMLNLATLQTDLTGLGNSAGSAAPAASGGGAATATAGESCNGGNAFVAGVCTDFSSIPATYTVGLDSSGKNLMACPPGQTVKAGACVTGP